jgi:GH15 family glucan-1,4-alpha-glucosidase
MARPIVLSNGELHVGINKYGLVHDFYFPYVGLENHAAGKSLRHRVGVWADNRISWLDGDKDWTFKFRYPVQALIGHTVARNDTLGILLEFDDFVDSHMSAFMRDIHVVNLRNEDREIRLFMHQAFAIGDSRSNTDTAQYLPENEAILHYRGRRAFVTSGMISDGSNQKFDQYTVGLFGIEGYEGSYRDADDGELSFSNVEHGRVDSVLRFKLQIKLYSSVRVHYWVAAGTSMHEALYVHKEIKDKGVYEHLHTTGEWWREWLKPTLKAAEKLPVDHQEQFIRSAMIIKSQTDKRGAVMASTDTTMLNYSRDAYAYSWPRDGAYAMWPLIRMGYQDEPRRFFEFCRRGLHPHGYLMHKYRADGALGSSWHPYIHDGVYAPPIQEDETALVLVVLAQFCDAQTNNTILHEFYDSMIKPMADFMVNYIDDTTGLPKPSYDLWEEVIMTTTYTTATVYAALLAAADMAEQMNDQDNAVKWRSGAEDIRQAAQKHLYNPDRGAFYKGVFAKDDDIHKDSTIDLSSFFGVFIFGLFAVDSEEVETAFKTIVATFGHDGKTFGLPRYEGDNYQRINGDTPPNWWPIASLWLAQYRIEKGEHKEAEAIIRWVEQHVSSTGIMSEQINPISESRLSVEPLTWSHAEYMSTLLDTIDEDAL